MSNNHWQNHIDSWTALEFKHPDDPRFMCEWEWLGEGWDGEFDINDPDDAPLLRFTVFVDDEPAEDASYCTKNAIDTDEIELKGMARSILDDFKDAHDAQRSWKKLMEHASHISP